MDPNDNLKQQRELTAGIIETTSRYLMGGVASSDGGLPDDLAHSLADRAYELAELVIALDEWIMRGGFLPQRWVSQII